MWLWDWKGRHESKIDDFIRLRCVGERKEREESKMFPGFEIVFQRE